MELVCIYEGKEESSSGEQYQDPTVEGPGCLKKMPCVAEYWYYST